MRCPGVPDRSPLVGAGNGVRRNRLLAEILADRFAMPLHIPALAEEAAMGDLASMEHDAMVTLASLNVDESNAFQTIVADAEEAIERIGLNVRQTSAWKQLLDNLGNDAG